MKKLLFFLFLLIPLFTPSCSDDSDSDSYSATMSDEEKALVGIWTTSNDLMTNPTYWCFYKNGTFKLYHYRNEYKGGTYLGISGTFVCGEGEIYVTADQVDESFSRFYKVSGGVLKLNTYSTWPTGSTTTLTKTSKVQGL